MFAPLIPKQSNHTTRMIAFDYILELSCRLFKKGFSMIIDNKTSDINNILKMTHIKDCYDVLASELKAVIAYSEVFKLGYELEQGEISNGKK